MPIKFTCTACQKRLVVKDPLAGKTIKCPVCAGNVLVPGANSPAPADGRVRFPCPSCQRPIIAAANLVGKPVACPGCKKTITVAAARPPEEKEDIEFKV